jgi:hypothetical protein
MTANKGTIVAKCAQLQARVASLFLRPAPWSAPLNIAICPQELLQQLSAESAASSTSLLASGDECVRMQEHTALLSKQLSRAAMQVGPCTPTASVWACLRG